MYYIITFRANIGISEPLESSGYLFDSEIAKKRRFNYLNHRLALSNPREITK